MYIKIFSQKSIKELSKSEKYHLVSRFCCKEPKFFLNKKLLGFKITNCSEIISPFSLSLIADCGNCILGSLSNKDGDVYENVT